MEYKGAYKPQRTCRHPTFLALPMFISLQDERRMAQFAQYAMVASEEALTDAGWFPKGEADLEATVRRLSKGPVCTLLTLR
jgi:3-oxoacyl-(acyl-carrier-protein) synthase